MTGILSLIKTHKKEIAGIVLSGVAIVAGVKIGRKVETKYKTVEKERTEQLDKIEEVLNNDYISEDVYSEEDAENDKRIINAKASIKSLGLYLPSTILVGSGATYLAMLTSNKVYKSTNSKLLTILTGFATEFIVIKSACALCKGEKQ